MNVTLNNQTFPLKEIEFSFGKRLISTVELNNEILNNGSEYVSEEARFIDEQIFYFVDNESLTLPDGELVSKILEEL